MKSAVVCELYTSNLQELAVLVNAINCMGTIHNVHYTTECAVPRSADTTCSTPIILEAALTKSVMFSGPPGWCCRIKP